MENVELQDIRRFSFTELKHITNGFSKECVIGDGGSGVVYKGLLDHGEVIAVKKLHYNQYNSSGENLVNGQTQFYNEIRNLILWKSLLSSLINLCKNEASDIKLLALHIFIMKSTTCQDPLFQVNYMPRPFIGVRLFTHQ